MRLSRLLLWCLVLLLNFVLILQESSPTRYNSIVDPRKVRHRHHHFSYRDSYRHHQKPQYRPYHRQLQSQHHHRHRHHYHNRRRAPQYQSPIFHHRSEFKRTQRVNEINKENYRPSRNGARYNYFPMAKRHQQNQIVENRIDSEPMCPRQCRYYDLCASGSSKFNELPHYRYPPINKNSLWRRSQVKCESLRIFKFFIQWWRKRFKC